MHLKRFIAAGLLVTALVTAGSCTSEDAANDQSDPEWLFALQATGVSSFDPDTGKLTIPVDTVLAFTDRPDRLAEFDSPQAFVELWSDDSEESFVADPPNIVITWWSPQGGYSESMEVASITGEIRYDDASGALSMTLAVDGSSPLDLPTSMDQVSVFVDGYSSNCPSNGGSATISGNGKSSPICINNTTF